ncbi:TonB-dependent receptor [Alteromonas sp. 1_MG-2023]|uniref:TonB-dependent receptor n=1 Tax=Alteromonas sp. 1_MG-2023 TaxID=3062669 RepID=UPI0026E11D50|nr:carboxypeptidase regulatory-like domain-containing protein [Alteromonas sp. 1_MG-2023]MDO6567189.1 TonB-dependent receptor [Alteromonas sp. 1_MG-2023]
MLHYKRSAAAFAVALSLGVATPVFANDTNGFIQGSTVEISGAEISGVTVTITNIDTGLVRTVQTDEGGDFRFPLLPAGIYKVVAEKDGFRNTIQESVKVGISGKTNLNMKLASDDVERIEVTGSTIAMVDVTSSSTGIVVDTVTLDRVPVPRNLTSVALLAPGTTQGDSAFGDLPSIGGASVGENGYYINGLNITNFRTGVGSSEPPFDMYETFEVKTGGYSAEYGRITGGVINAKTKSGSNEFKAGVNVYWEPDALREQKNSYRRTTNGTYRIDNTGDEKDSWDANVWASGALIEDKLFFYALFNPRSVEENYVGEQQINSDGLVQNGFTETDEDAFWVAKVDWYATENNILEVTVFSDERSTEIQTFDSTDGVFTKDSRVGYEDEGGLNYTAKWTSIITDDFSISAQYGVNKQDRTVRSELDANPVAYFTYDSTGAFVPTSTWAGFTVEQGDDKREVIRIDADWYIGDHSIRFGYDYENLTASSYTINSGGAYYLYYVNDDDPANEEIYQVRHRDYEVGGDFDSENIAFYVQDQWQVTDNLVINAGIRNDSFENFNADGETFVKLDNLWALRLGAVWDVRGDGETKAWASFGRYYLPVAANTNIRLAGAETYTQEYYEFDGYADESLFIPNLTGDKTQPDDVFANGEAKSPAELVDQNIDAMYSDEFIAGYQFQLNDEWSMAIQGTYRELATTVEDMAIDAAVIEWAAANGYGDVSDIWGGFHQYVLTNPNIDMRVGTTELPGANGELVYMDLSAEDLGYPDSIRKYAAVDFTFQRAWDGVWMFNAAYTWSHNWGNNEGYVRSDNGQDDAGLTTLFDQPGLLDGAYGDLPQDRRHQVKMYGAYAVTEDLTLGANLQFWTGRPINAFGYHPTDTFAQAYDSESFYAGGELSPRGSRGRTSSYYSIDISASYNIDIGEDQTLVVRADVFNVLNNDKVTEVYEIYDSELSEDPLNPDVDPNYGTPTAWQTPRYVRFSVNYTF